MPLVSTPTLAMLAMSAPPSEPAKPSQDWRPPSTLAWSRSVSTCGTWLSHVAPGHAPTPPTSSPDTASRKQR